MSSGTEQSAVSAVLDLSTVWQAVEAWLALHVLNWATAGQALALALALFAARLAQRRLAPAIEHFATRATRSAALRVPLLRLRGTIAPAVAALVVWLAYVIASAVPAPAELLRIAANLLTAWVIIHFATGFLRQRGWAALIATLVWGLAALAILGWLAPIYHRLDATKFRAGDLEISVLGLINGIVLLFAFILLSGLLARLVDDRMMRLEGVTPAARVLFGKVLRIVLYVLATIVALTSIGIDLTAVAVFSGALGLGIGFGLQKVVSNLFSGIVLLLDRSLKPGDVIEVGTAYGWIEKMGARYITVATRDGKEYLIPNEDLVTQQVINWSYSDRAVRVRIGVGISYRSDVRKAMDLMVQAALTQPRVLGDAVHVPQVRLVRFGDSSVDLELRIWVTDPEKGLQNVSSEIRLLIWDTFHQHGVEFPFPQRDLHISSAPGLLHLVDGLRRNDAPPAREV
jgi:small-conductance mechanosensitive channel